MTMLMEAQNLSIGYEGRQVASGLNFSLGEGDYLCVVGENGSGKSTLLKVMLGLAAPLSGAIRLGGGLNRNEIGYLPQQTQLQRDFPASVREIVQSGCLNRCGLRPFYRKDERAIAQRNMEKLGIADIASKSYSRLSGGQQQRTLLARALCASRRVLLLDEPVSGLDPTAVDQLYQFVDRLNAEEGIAVVMVSHDVSVAATHASHILHVSGSAPFFGKKADYLLTDIGKAYTAVRGGDAQ